MKFLRKNMLHNQESVVYKMPNNIFISFTNMYNNSITQYMGTLKREKYFGLLP